MAEKMTTFEILMKAKDLVSALIESEGETSEEIDRQFDEFIGVSEKKMINHSMVIAYAEDEAQRLKKMAAKITAEAKKYENTAKRVREHAKMLLEQRVELMGWEQGKRVETDAGPIFLRKRRVCTIKDEEGLLDALKGAESQHPHLSHLIRRSEAINKSELSKRMLDEMNRAGIQEHVDSFVEIEEKCSITFK